MNYFTLLLYGRQVMKCFLKICIYIIWHFCLLTDTMQTNLRVCVSGVRILVHSVHTPTCVSAAGTGWCYWRSRTSVCLSVHFNTSMTHCITPASHAMPPVRRAQVQRCLTVHSVQLQSHLYNIYINVCSQLCFWITLCSNENNFNADGTDQCLLKTLFLGHLVKFSQRFIMNTSICGLEGCKVLIKALKQVRVIIIQYHLMKNKEIRNVTCTMDLTCWFSNSHFNLILIPYWPETKPHP